MILITRDLCKPPKVKKRGHPKGVETTVIGPPKKKCKGDKPLPFVKMSPKDREKGCQLI